MTLSSATYHIPVLLKESIEGLNVSPDGTYADMTFGGGGHSRELLSRLGAGGRLFGFDQDGDAEARVESGDRLVPFGMRGTKLVSDLLTDSKLPLPARQRQLVLADGSGRVVWVVGLRSDNRFRIAPDTRQALVITIEQG